MTLGLLAAVDDELSSSPYTFRALGDLYGRVYVFTVDSGELHLVADAGCGYPPAQAVELARSAARLVVEQAERPRRRRERLAAAVEAFFAELEA